MNTISDWGRVVAGEVAKMVGERHCSPLATYRLQFAKDRMTFRDAAAIVPYLDELGISHIYASPYFKTQSGGSNAYAIVDYGQLNPELGGEEQYRPLVEALSARKMGQIIDIVPNHMSAVPVENRWWTDVLENGPSSPFAAYFDIDWRPVKEQLHDRILLPVLGDQYGQVLERGELKLEYSEGAFFIRYYQTLFPLDPRTYRLILARRMEEFKANLPAESKDLRELESIVTALEHLPERTETETDRVTERQREKEVVKDRLRRLVERSLEIADFIRQNVRDFNGTPDDPRTFDELDKLLDAQVYRLSHWKAAADEINYRRFFDINDLAAVCTEDPRIFQESHKLAFDLLVCGDAAGLRIDHIDGLYDPMEYLRRLQWNYLRALGKIAYRQMIESSTHAQAIVTGQDSNGNESKSEAPPNWSDVEPAFLDNALALLDRTPAVSDSTFSPLRAPTEGWSGEGQRGEGPRFEDNSAFRGGGKNPRARGAAPAAVAHRRNHRLRFPEFGKWPVRRRVRVAGTGQVVRPFHRPAAKLPGSGAPIKNVDPPHRHVQRPAIARPPAESYFRTAPALA